LAQPFFKDKSTLNAQLKKTKDGQQFIPVENIEDLLRKKHIYNQDGTFNQNNFEKIFTA